MENSQNVKLFVSVAVPNKIAHELHRIQQIFKASGVCEGTYPDPEASHVTLQFIGFVKKQEIEPIIATLQSVQFHPFSITFDSINFFEKNEKPSVVYLNSVFSDLSTLAQRVSHSLEPWIKQEERPFVGHLTIMRIKKIYDEHALRKLLNTVSIDPLSWNATSFSLMESKYGNGKHEYTELALLSALKK